MCGIIGYKGKEDGRKTVLEGLKRLEYRGYDSWGIASNDWVEKQTGQVAAGEYGKPSTILIGHTRWATHGKVTKENAHPHFSNDGTIAVVHNGILDNYKELRNKLSKYKFKSETDTETIPNLIQENISGGFITAFKKTITELKGTYAIAAINKDILAFARNSSPLLIGISKDKHIVASDAAPLTDAEKVIYLKDGEWGYIDEELHLFNKEGPIKPELQDFKPQSAEHDKRGYQHFMLKEIYEQPETITKAKKQTRIEEVRQTIKGKEIFLLGCGTSYHACLAAAKLFSKKGTRATAILASEHKHALHDGIAIAVSQSGETADLIEAIKKFHGKKIGIINVPGSTLTRMCDIVLPMNAGTEIAVASTKAFTATLTILSILAEENVDRLSEQCRMDQWAAQAKDIAKQIRRDIIIIGRQEAYAYALEAALKIKEIAYLRAEGMPAAELKHGTLALIEESTPVIAIATPETRQDTINNAQEAKARGAKVIGIDKQNHETYDTFIQCQDPRLSVIPMQMLAYELAISKGYDPDKPRNLAKSVTVK